MSYWILCLEGSGKEMKKGITGKSADSQSNEELDEMLVEESLHDGDDKNAKIPQREMTRIAPLDASQTV